VIAKFLRLKKEERSEQAGPYLTRKATRPNARGVGAINRGKPLITKDS
jgi:hypothetical protein